MNIKFLLVALSYLLISTAAAADNSSSEVIFEVVKAFVYKEAQNLPGKIIIKTGRSDSGYAPRSCQQPEPFLPAGGRIWGKFSVGVRCQGEAAWTLYVPVEIQVITSVVHAARLVSIGKPLDAQDIVIKEVDLVRIPREAATDPNQVIGKVAATHLSSGQPVRMHQLRAPHVISRGQRIRLIATGAGFTVSTEGEALTAAAEGEVVQVRSNQAKRIISGIARPGGIVEIRQ